MQFPRLSIQSQPALLGMNTQPASQQIQQPKADMQIQQPRADVSITTKPGKLSIDQSKAWADMGKFASIEATKKAANQGKQAVMEAISQKANEGNQLMKIENGGNVIASLSKQQTMADVKPAALDWIPSHFSVKTNYTPAEVEVSAQARKPVINTTPQKVVHEYQPGNLDIYVRQSADLQIEFQA
ncbi:hypothetical protein FPQ10_10870 [Allobacillus sp. SKP2-8]|uniref:DUF6470 family protein n=1 Tax=unclassified Allobacillus TaxID=2628859 RepID=UPI0011844FA9|nr:DUF6470 family protein [Allobacillus sp. SKP2-8]TSJ63726.1 hypothetical protein FPQ10_10870 [Allobacillus sp. SKP2-8]